MPEFFQNQIFIQILGFVALGLGVSALLHKKDNALKVLLSCQSFVLSAHFFLLGANGATVACFVSGTRNLTSIYSKFKHLAIFFITLYVVLGYFRYESWIDLLPLSATIVTTIGFFYLEKIPMRLTVLYATSMWLIHNAIVMSLGPLIMESLIFVANLKTIYSLYKEDKTLSS